MTPERLAGIRHNAIDGVYFDEDVVRELLAHIDTLEGKAAEAEAAIETLHEKYAQERISRSRQTLSDNTKMENQ